jgi:periplasmic divalent cation tolerance protein
MNYCFLYVPINDSNIAKQIAHSLIANNLAACINIVPSITSIYEWEDKIEESNELIMLVKTKNTLAESARQHIESLHPYDIPCVAEIDISRLNKKYANWLNKFFAE